MSKNPKFHKLPNDTWGLTDWYPSARESKEPTTQTKDEKEEVVEVPSKTNKDKNEAKDK
jgi:DNA-directed RNA polymerase delta subunit